MRRNKFNAVKTTINGIRFDSKREAKRYTELLLLVRAGEIKGLALQEVIFLQGRDGPLKTATGRNMRLTVDFTYTDCKTGLKIFEDSKGAITRDYEVRRSVALAQGVTILET